MIKTGISNFDETAIVLTGVKIYMGIGLFF